MLANFFMTPEQLWSRIGGASAPFVVDVRRREAYAQADGVIPGSVWRDPATLVSQLVPGEAGRGVVFACKEGHELSQSAAAALRARGIEASVLAGGYAGWARAGLALVSRAALDRFITQRPSLWVTRRRPKIDRVACPWLIRRFLDPQAKILFVDPPEVPSVARETGAVPFDIEGVELSHEGERCSFDTMLKVFGLEDEPSLGRLALIVRGADTARFDLAPQAAGLIAISLGLSQLAGDDDHAMLEQGFLVYDALFAWLRFAAGETHNWPAKAA